MKKYMLMMLCLILCLPCAALAEGEEPEREVLTSGDYTYVILDDGTAEITKYSGDAKTLEIPSELDGNAVTVIGDEAFSYCLYLTSVKIPDGVTSINHKAFNGCSNLTILTIPNGVISIREQAFFGCSKLTSVMIPDSVTVIEERAFYGCSDLMFIVIPDSVTMIGDKAFSDCSRLEALTIPDSVTIIGENPFAKCDSLTSINVSPDHPVLATIDNVLFSKADKRLICYPCAFVDKTYSIPQGIEIIGDSAFLDCSNLASVLIPDSHSRKVHRFRPCLYTKNCSSL